MTLFSVEFISAQGNSLLRLLCCVRHLPWCWKHLMHGVNAVLRNIPVCSLMPRTILCPWSPLPLWFVSHWTGIVCLSKLYWSKLAEIHSMVLKPSFWGLYYHRLGILLHYRFRVFSFPFPFLSEMLLMFHHSWTKRLQFSGNLGNPQHPYPNPHDLAVERDYFNPTLSHLDFQCLYFPEFVIASVVLFWSLLVSWLSLRV